MAETLTGLARLTSLASVDNLERPADEWVGHELSGRDGLLADASARGRRFLEGLPTRRVFPADESVRALDGLDVPLSEDGSPAREVLARLDLLGSPAAVASAGPRYFGFVTGGALPIAAATEPVDVGWDQNSALGVMSPVAAARGGGARMARRCARPPEGTGGGFVNGATMANATCLAAARDAVCARAGWNAGEHGLGGGPPVEVVVGEEAHTTLRKALGLIGLGRDRVVALPRRLRRPDTGSESAEPAAAGDRLPAGRERQQRRERPFAPLAGWARQQEAWAHGDGAFGALGERSPLPRRGAAGVRGADSWGTDAHKWLKTTYYSGTSLSPIPPCRDRRRPPEGGLPPFGRGARSDALHTTELVAGAGRRVLGGPRRPRRRGLVDLAEHTCALDRRSHPASARRPTRPERGVPNQVVLGLGSAECTVRGDRRRAGRLQALVRSTNWTTGARRASVSAAWQQATATSPQRGGDQFGGRPSGPYACGGRPHEPGPPAAADRGPGGSASLRPGHLSRWPGGRAEIILPGWQERAPTSG